MARLEVAKENRSSNVGLARSQGNMKNKGGVEYEITGEKTT